MRFCALVGLIASLALACGQTVEFPIGYYSYDEIARMMSTAHRRVECAPELKTASRFCASSHAIGVRCAGFWKTRLRCSFAVQVEAMTDGFSNAPLNC